MVVYFGEEVENALKTYLYTTRKQTIPLSGHENALFLSTQRKRMGVQAVENMVKKYAREVTPNKKITPHKLRSTYGTALYKETGDWGIKMSIQQRNIMQQSMKTDAVRRQVL